MLKNKNKIRIGITMGDPSGIGPEVIVKAMPFVRGAAEFLIIGDSQVLERAFGQRKIQACAILDLKNVGRDKFFFGKIKAEYGRASIEYLDKSISLLKNKKIDCLVTCPISKEAINLAGYHYSGHTEYLIEKTKTKHAVMLLLNKQMRFSLVTRHIPLKKVSQSLNKRIIEDTVTLTYKALKEMFLIKNPRLIVCGINPHGSDNAVIGDEENVLIAPAVKRLAKRFKGVYGPLGADVAIAKAKDKKYDCVIAMYHDQALIPLKLLGDETGVNMTLGLPFIRTSPLHGTAFDIAGKSKADPASMIAAIRLALECEQNRRKA
jgi:4-hydroxythreonine-4-phosphate dehydrogenase